jgi:oligopeptide/dipeptide ABC transporter ATP-binding protein
MTALLEVENLVKRFPIVGSRLTVQALNGVSFTLSAGETLSLVGESGSGKTTVGRCVLGLTDKTSGSVRFEGRELAGRRTLRESWFRGRAQLVFQEPAEGLNPRLRIGDSIGEPLRVLRVNSAELGLRIREAARRVGIDERLLESLPAQLSGGMLQRVAIARALVSNPAILVLDEPTSSLDPTSRAEIIDLLKQLQHELGTAYLFISHDLSTVHFLSDRIAVMYLGMIVEQGPAADLFSAPHHPYSLSLLASVLLPIPNLQPDASLALAGEIPSPINLPAGCFLAGRCPIVADRCRVERPVAELVGNNHFVHCFYHERATREMRATDAFNTFQNVAAALLDLSASGQKQPSRTGDPECQN